MGATTEMKMARPRFGEFDAVWEFLSDLDAIMEYGSIPIAHEDRDGEEFGPEADPQAVFDWLHKQWPRFESSWQRVLLAGQVAIDNACDPTIGHLAFKPEILAAIERGNLTYPEVDYVI